MIRGSQGAGIDSKREGAAMPCAALEQRHPRCGRMPDGTCLSTCGATLRNAMPVLGHHDYGYPLSPDSRRSCIENLCLRAMSAWDHRTGSTPLHLPFARLDELSERKEP